MHPTNFSVQALFATESSTERLAPDFVGEFGGLATQVEQLNMLIIEKDATILELKVTGIE